ncbi:MAG: DUF4038 domain-containing protein [Eubacteriales bacterium]|nr:DUF4038 domain-containing protein [Eubacteriales bacterium]
MERLKISENGRYFELPDKTPFPWLADTAWTLPQRLKWDDVDYYMKKRKSQGFTVLQIVALDPERDVCMQNPAGIPALLDGNLETPNEAYFTWLDWCLDRAEAYGFYVLLLPVWGQLVVGDNWRGDTFPKTVTLANAKGYGEWIGRRYGKRPNILWCLGGDRQPIHKGVDYRDVWRALAEGLAKGVTGKDLDARKADPAWEELLITYHTCYEMETGKCSTYSYWGPEEAWIRFTMLQSGHTKQPRNDRLIDEEYQKEPPKPVWDGEPAYEKMPTNWPVTTEFHGTWMVRKRAYWSLFAGAFGYTYGHASVWCMISERERNEMHPDTWYEAVHSEGSGQMKFLREFLDATQIQTCVPAQELLEDPQDGVRACKKADGSSVYLYFPKGGRQKPNFQLLGWEDLYLTWYNPRTGTCCATGKGTIGKEIETPTQGNERDWILIASKEMKENPVPHKEYYSFEEKTKAEKVFQW